MNKCHFVGKLTDDPVLYPRGQTTLARFTLAVEEYRKDIQEVVKAAQANVNPITNLTATQEALLSPEEKIIASRT